MSNPIQVTEIAVQILSQRKIQGKIAILRVDPFSFQRLTVGSDAHLPARQGNSDVAAPPRPVACVNLIEPSIKVGEEGLAMAERITFELNGETQNRRGGTRHAALIRAAQRARAQQPAFRLRARAMRRLHGPCRRRAGAVLLLAGIGGGRDQGHDPHRARHSRRSPHPLQTAFIAEQVPQCGYCLNGWIMTAAALLRDTPHPSEQQIRDGLSGLKCRCGTHMAILRAVRRAAHAA